MLPNPEWWSPDRQTDRPTEQEAGRGGREAPSDSPIGRGQSEATSGGFAALYMHRAPTMGDWARWLLMVKLPRNLYGAFRFIRRSGRAGSRTAPLFPFLFTDAAVTEILRARRRPWNRGNKFHVRINNPGGSDARVLARVENPEPDPGAATIALRSWRMVDESYLEISI